MFGKNFKRTKENFICGNCGAEVIGDGYTNHCPNCLYSKHVDINPGDRAATCHGLMKPIDAVMKKGTIYIIHECVRCGFTKQNKFQKQDDQVALQEINKNKIFG